MLSNFIFKIINLFPLLFLKTFSNFKFFKNQYFKRERSFAIRSYFTTTIKILRNFNFDNNIIISPKNGNFIETDDIRLSFEKFNRHLKSIGSAVNEGNYCKRFFQKINLEPEVIIDIGANVGEISLFLNKNFPNAKIYALEPSSENFKVISKNISSQSFDTDKIILKKIAITDTNGILPITCGLQAENTMLSSLIDKKVLTEKVESKTLLQFIKAEKIKAVDFIKIDIEGGEPLLIEDLKKCKNIVKSYLIEFSIKSKIIDVHKLLRIMFENNYKAYTKENLKKILIFQEAEETLNQQFKLGFRAVDLFFVRENH